MNARHEHNYGLGLYVHTPFCETKCGYCDFYSVALKDRNPAPLVDAIIAELRARVASAEIPTRTIFLGGGTPTVLPTCDLSRLLDAVVDCVDMCKVEEFTVEANPATIDDEKAKTLVDHGVTRVSMGAQSFFPDELAALERLHTPDDIAPSVETLRRHGLGNLNIDLIFGIPSQTPHTWAASLKRAIELDVQHVACYGLTYEPTTRLTAQRNAGTVTPCDEDLEADMFIATRQTLETAGLEQYEISNYAKPGLECKHNLIYWRNEPYIGVGPSAAGCLPQSPTPEPQALACADTRRQERLDSDNAPRVFRRYKNIADVNGYTRLIALQGHAEVESEEISTETLVLEIILMQLRLVEGISIKVFNARTGKDPVALFGDSLQSLVDRGLLTIGETRIALTDSGMLVANAVMAELAAATGTGSTSLPIINQ